ncbi:MAG TPA: hypothetical protein VEL02_04680 [Jatrophihabitantaceae bacterium]|nr:hypothetical protein [Jatrophihabitantaceae bacterium]
MPTDAVPPITSGGLNVGPLTVRRRMVRLAWAGRPGADGVAEIVAVTLPTAGFVDTRTDRVL